MPMKKLSLFITSITWIGFGYAQESTNASGGDASGSGGSVAYSVGQVAYTSTTNSSGSVSQGVQQTYEISDVGIKETEMNISLVVFPNPTTDNLTLEISDYNNEELKYQLYDMQGKLLKAADIVAKETQINMLQFSKATYFINILDEENRKVQSFKIIKN
jgi:hypothetical protein